MKTSTEKQITDHQNQMNQIIDEMVKNVENLDHYTLYCYYDRLYRLRTKINQAKLEDVFRNSKYI